MLQLLLSLLLGHLSLSLFFFLFPSYLHPPNTTTTTTNTTTNTTNTNTNKVLLIAHRGGSLVRPENTIPAFDNAIELGANVIEMDLCETKDR
jgi:glycerophosphoryl diester phosphodiesterase